MESHNKLYDNQHLYEDLHKLKESNPSLFNVAIEIAESTYNNDYLKKYNSDVTTLKKEQLNEQELFQLSDGTLSYKNSDALSVGIAIFLVEKKLLPCLDNRGEFSSCLSAIICHGYNLKLKELFNLVIIILHNEYKKNIIELILLPIDDNQQIVQTIYPHLKEILPSLIVEESLLYKFITFLADRFKN